jgi:hypothetical protein
MVETADIAHPHTAAAVSSVLTMAPPLSREPSLATDFINGIFMVSSESLIRSTALLDGR